MIPIIIKSIIMMMIDNVILDKIFRTYGRFFGFALGCYLQLVGGENICVVNMTLTLIEYFVASHITITVEL